MKSLTVVFIVLACTSTASAQFPVENTLMHTVGVASPSNGVSMGYNPTLNLPVGTYRYHYSTTGGTFISNFFVLTNFNSWIPGGNFASTGTPVSLLFNFNVPSGLPLCWNEVLHIVFERRSGLNWWTAGVFDLRVFIVRDGERGHLVSDDTTGAIYYGGFDGKAHRMRWTGSGWAYDDINSSNGWGAVRIAGRMTIFADGKRIFFKGTDARLWQLVRSGTIWTLSQVSATLPNVAGAVATRNSDEIVFYGSDQQLHRLILIGTTWSHQIVAPSGGWSAAGDHPKPESIALPYASTRIFYINQNGALCDLSGSVGSWTIEQISPNYTAGIEILAVEENEVYYTNNKRIHRYVKTTSWLYDPMTISTSSESNVAVNELAFLAKFFGQDKIFYKASDGRIFNAYIQAGTWYNYPLVPAANNTAGDVIAAQWKIFTIDHARNVHTTYWDGTRWIEGPLSIAFQAQTEGCISAYTW